ncbi:dipeptidase [Desulfopila sp. IMCC35008]|uniref:dipeptidase n=1 Tax=Desulfopila sp. IMCC35008 TaxID=2653858 RepID=UPI0013D63EEC|nr:dipeptidase [Desulfopila sp. IMCC35008]
MTLQQRITQLHHQAFTVDAHFDLCYEVANMRERGDKKVIEKTFLNQFRAGSFDLIVSAIFVHNYFLPEMGLRKALDQISHLHAEIDESPGLFRICRTCKEARQAKEDGEIALFLSLEGADPLQNDPGLLRIFYELGVRGLGLVWSRRNAVGDGAFFASQREGQKGGLTPFGIDLIEQAERLGMFIDVSHLNDEGFLDVMNVAQKPLIASHSNCRALARTMRNLTDDQIKSLAAKGGVIGMNSVDAFVHDDAKKATMDDFVNHVDHIANLVGIDHVGIGFDICCGFPNHLSMPDNVEATDLISDHGHLEEFTEQLIRHGYSDEDIMKVLGDNFMRVYSETTG